VPLGLPSTARGVLPSQYLRRALDEGIVKTAGETTSEPSVQPASLDLHLGDVAYSIRCSFLPEASSVEEKLGDVLVEELDLRNGAVLQKDRPYLIPLVEELSLPQDLRARANPKSSTGRLDVFTRVVTDNSPRFDEIRPGYHGRLYLEVVPLSFTVRVRSGLALNQLRLVVGSASLSDDEIRAAHAEEPLLSHDDVALDDSELVTASGLFLGLDLLRGSGRNARRVGYRAKEHSQALDMWRVGAYESSNYWESVEAEIGDRIVLAPGRFYLLLSDESVRIPPGFAAEMTAYDPTSGELRTHYAGFFDPGFGHDQHGEHLGSRAALEVRAHDVPFMIEHRQPVCKLTFERMVEDPDVLYGAGIGSSYQYQAGTLSKHFRRAEETKRAPSDTDPQLFDDAR
jgi:dCTP deaminase